MRPLGPDEFYVKLGPVVASWPMDGTATCRQCGGPVGPILHLVPDPPSMAGLYCSDACIANAERDVPAP